MFRRICTVWAYGSPAPTILPEASVAVVPETCTKGPARTAREYPTMGSHGVPVAYRRRSISAALHGQTQPHPDHDGAGRPVQGAPDPRPEARGGPRDQEPDPPQQDPRAHPERGGSRRSIPPSRSVTRDQGHVRPRGHDQDRRDHKIGDEARVHDAATALRPWML